MDVRQLEAFQAVMTCGTTARAADVLRISQPAVSKAIAALERSVGFRLFDREKGRLIPSPEGQLFFAELQPTFAGLAKLRSAAARIRDYGSGLLRVGCLSAFSTNLVPTAIAAFHRRNPDVAVSLFVMGSSAIRDMVAAGQLDVALVADEVDTTGVEAEPFAESRAALALTPDHPLADRTHVVPEDLDGLPFVALAPEDTTRREAEAVFARHGAAPRVVVETAYSSTVCALVLAGVGCGIVDPVTAAGYLERGLILKPIRPAVCFRTLLLLPPRKRSRITIEFCRALSMERDRLA